MNWRFLNYFLFIFAECINQLTVFIYEKIYIMDDDSNPYLQSSDVYIMYFGG
jgi:hypothetical protein